MSTVFLLISQKTEIARSVREPKLQGPRAEDALAEPYFVPKILITADHNVLSENCESRNNHRYAIVVQDLATQWIQSYPCKTTNSQETQRSLQKFLESDRKPKVIYTDNTLEFGRACEDLSWNLCTSTPHRSETNGIGNLLKKTQCERGDISQRKRRIYFPIADGRITPLGGDQD